MKSRIAPVASFLVLAALACDHTDPLQPTSGGGDRAPDQPLSAPFPRQLTFNRGGDTDPHVFDASLVYSRRPIPQSDSDWCLAFLPVEGGVLSRSSCPTDGAENGTKEAYLQPAVSPDGQRIVFVEEIGDTSRLSLTPWTRRIMIAPLSDPSEATQLFDMSVGLYTIVGQIGDIPANSVHRLQWRDNDNIIFVAGTVRTLAGALCCDTLYVPMALIEADVNQRTWQKLDIGPLPPSDVFVTESGAIRFTQEIDPALWRQYETCAQFAVICPEDKIWELDGDSVRVVADFSAMGAISRMFGRGGVTLVLSGTGQLFSLDPAATGFTQLEVLPVGDLEDMAINATGTRAVALTRTNFPLPDLWLVKLD